MPVPPRTDKWGRNVGIVVGLVALATGLAAQDLPPLPGGGTGQPPREPTPEELEAQRQAREAYWAANREMFAPYLHTAPPPEPEDLVLKQQLMSAELLERQQAIESRMEARRQRDEGLKSFAARMREQTREADELLRRLVPAEVIEEFDRQGLQLEMRDGRLVAVASMNAYAQRTIGTLKAKTNAPVNYPLNASSQLVGL
jgi:hypothetical protein